MKTRRRLWGNVCRATGGTSPAGRSARSRMTSSCLGVPHPSFLGMFIRGGYRQRQPGESVGVSETRPQWTPSQVGQQREKFELVEQITEDISICRTVTPSAAMGIIAPRDFVDVILVKQYEDGTISSNATNVTHASCPPQSGFVRGFNHPCGCICVPISGEPNKTQVFSFFQTDLGGLLPRSVVDSFFPSSMSEFYGNLAKAVKSLKDF
ncbi:StAR-related lipid transfer protein 5 START domain-containing protein 5 [Larimichthys crocea]|uniref:StAR-related lipid transfer protein 5 START domain-containing protein 5 n=1 Tax=Larimichthys crocea TaxID=215358 RepID=A0A6G0J291_LARCR|nr:StAR-related lipid transfer protein 5 START domain-containing protein 5 [Larimichthys crocea]